MAKNPIKKITGFISLTLMGIILISVISDFKADMYVKDGSSGKRTEEQQDNNYVPANKSIKVSISPKSTNTGNTSNTNIGNSTNTSNSSPNNNIELQRNTSINPLTGQPSGANIAQNRPVAVSISNQRDALPTNATNGISEADIVYEFLVEGGTTRFLGIYQDFSKVGVVGSIRSARHYMVELVEAYNAMFIHAGGSPLGFEEIDNRGITAFDSVRGKRAQIFNLDVNRIPGQTVLNYHGQTTSGALFTRHLPSYDIKTTHSDKFIQALFFTDNPIPTGVKADKITARFSSTKSSIFSYDSDKKLYFMSQFGSQFKDANNDAPVAFTNLLILETPVKDLEGHGAGAGRQDMSTVGGGTGYFASAGRYIKINWFRTDKSSQFIYTDKNGNIIDLGKGKTYIAIVPEGSNTVFN